MRAGSTKKDNFFGAGIIGENVCILVIKTGQHMVYVCGLALQEKKNTFLISPVLFTALLYVVISVKCLHLQNTIFVWYFLWANTGLMSNSPHKEQILVTRAEK